MFYSGAMQSNYEMGSYLHDQSVELYAHTSYPVIELQSVPDYIKGFATDPEAQINALFEKCKLVVRQPVADTTPPQLPLTQRAYNFGVITKSKARTDNTELSQEVCAEAEPRLWRSIARVRNQRSSKSLPAAVIFDKNGEPCGYQKNNGNPLTYFWRDAVVRTIGGECIMPADAFVDLNYLPGDDPRRLYSGVGLIALQRELPTENPVFMRFSNANLPQGIRSRVFASVADSHEKLETYKEAATFTPSDVCDVVMRLLKDGRAHIVR